MFRIIYFLYFLILTQLTSCGVGYYLHLFKGQLNIVTSTTDVKYFRDATKDSTILKKLVIVDSLLVFANEIGLNTRNNYQSYFDTQGEPISWNVSASQPDTFKSFLWEFPIVGSVPYKGFFDKNRAQSEYSRLKALNYDVHMAPISAYSTLGYFSDPLLSTMLTLEIGNLTELLLHELTHSTVYLSDMTDFNESFASFVGRKGAEQFLEQQFGPRSEYFQNLVDSRTDLQRFRLFMEKVVDRLDSLYSTEVNVEEIMFKRKFIFDEQKVLFSASLHNYKNQNYKNFLDWDLNNARLLSYKRYNSAMPNFQAVYEDYDESIEKLITLAITCSKMKDSYDCIQKTFDFDISKTP